MSPKSVSFVAADKVGAKFEDAYTYAAPISSKKSRTRIIVTEEFESLDMNESSPLLEIVMTESTPVPLRRMDFN